MDSKPRPQDEALIGRDYRDALPADRQASDNAPILFNPAEETNFDIVFESEIDEGGEA